MLCAGRGHGAASRVGADAADHNDGYPAVAPVLGRQRAHEVVYDACRNAIENGHDLAHELRKHPDLVAQLGESRIDELCDPANYLGSARTMTTDVIDAAG